MIKICIMGLGYVGLPLCLTISKKYKTAGFDINKDRITELLKKNDVNNEFKSNELNNKKIFFTDKIVDIKNYNFFIICVPTPINNRNKPDLNPVKKSFNYISKILKKGDIIVLESTVYPGVTKKYTNFLEKKTKLKNNKDFYLCYSPERINPGDKENNLTKINKILAISTKNNKIIKKVKNVYKNFCKKLIITNNIQEAEAAKVIENIQRDLNIAIFNEVLMICEKLKIDFSEVIRLAKTKWNFLNFQPGLVGGHCLPVDPFYLSYIANKKKIKTITALAGRKTNDKMQFFVLDQFKNFIKQKKKLNKKCKILVVGLTYKYGVADMRNSLNFKIYDKIRKDFFDTFYYDPFVNIDKSISSFNEKTIKSFDVVIFLSKGLKFKKLYNRFLLNNPNCILDPFYYYNQ
jgi:UDP-N-acetyl-D-glucosamine/UDP-N-acetyl-D-galactosamine dehydrogenase